MKKREGVFIAACAIGLPAVDLLYLVCINPPIGHDPLYELGSKWRQLIDQPYAWTGWVCLLLLGLLAGSVLAFAASFGRRRIFGRASSTAR